MDRENRVIAIETAGEERSDFNVVDRGEHLGNRRIEFSAVFRLLLRRSRFDQLEHHIDVFDFFAKIHNRENCLFKTINLRNMPLGLIVVIPKIGRAHLGVERFYFTEFLFPVKETSITVRLVF